MNRRRFLGGLGVTGALTAFGASAGLGPLGCAIAGGRRGGRAAAVEEIDAGSFHASRRFVATRFGRIAYVERGRGPAALFLHGLPLNGFQWRGALARLAAERRCIAADSMGLGYSEIPEGQALGPHEQAEMFAAFLDALGIGRVDLVASDSGGAVAQLFVARQPERVRSLLLTNCDVHADSPPPALLPVIEAARAGTFADDVLAPQLRDHAVSRSKAGLGGCCYTDPARFPDASIEIYLRPLLSSELRKRQLHAYCVALATNPLLAIEPALRRSPVPLRVVWGTGDTIFDPAGADWLARTFPRSRGVRRVPGANLFFAEEMPDLIAEEARALWQDEEA